MSSTMTIPSRPSTSLSWADDDEDDFDFEAWKSTADISAPSFETLPPLQLPTAEPEPSFTTTVSSSWVAVEPNQVSDPDCETSFGKSVLLCRLMADKLDAPAYPEMSAWGKEKRVSYAANWVRMKLYGRWGFRTTVLFRPSGLCQVEFCEQEEVVDTQAIELVGEDGDGAKIREPGMAICLEEAFVEEVQLSTTPPGSPSSLKLITSFTPIRTPDEGYYSDTSPPISPTLPISQEALDSSICTAHVGMSPVKENNQKHGRHDSFDVFRSLESEHIGTSKDTSPDLPYIDGNPTFSTYLCNTVETGWFLISQLPWTSLAMTVAGAVAGGLMHMARQC
jgi:hypothetical protein